MKKRDEISRVSEIKSRFLARAVSLILCFFVFFFVMPSSVVAQVEVPEHVSKLVDSVKDAFQGLKDGIKVGRVEIHPGFTVELEYDDNIFLEADQTFANGTSEGKSEDVIITLIPSIDIQRARGLGEFFGFGVSYRALDENFIDITTEDATEHDVRGEVEFGGAGGRAEMTIAGRYFDTVDPASSEFASNFNPRAEREDARIGGDGSWEFSPLFTLEGGAEYRSNTYKEAIFQTEDSENVKASGGFFWKWTPITSFGVRGSYRAIMYDNPGTINTDSDTYTATGVVKWAPTALVSGEVGVGYESRNFDTAPVPDFGREDRDDVRVDVNLNYRYTDRTRFALYVSRTVEDSSFQSIDAFVKTALKFSWFQDWRRKIKSEVSFDYQNHDYNESGVDIPAGGVIKDREDDRIAGEISVEYLIQEWLKTDVYYRYRQNFSNFDAKDYENNRVGIVLSAIF
ncbi:MAG: outer membrane beta-barrel protein [Nitrospinales bacterium]